MTLTKKSKLLIATAAIALVLIVAVPTAFATTASDFTNNPVQGTRNLVAKGIARQTVNGESVAMHANFTLTLQRTGTNTTIPRFNVIAGEVEINGTIYTITGGNGGVVKSKHALLLQAQATGSDGQTVTLKLAGRYFWMGGRLFVLRMAGSLQTDSGKIGLLMRAAIRI